MKRGIALLVGCLLGIPAVTQAAQERKSPLADAPAIRKRFELRDKRIELGVGMSATIGQDFYNAVMINLRAGFHFTDWLGLSVSAGVFNITPNWRSSFNNQLNSALATSCRDPNNAGLPVCTGTTAKTSVATDKTPTQANAAAAENRIGQVLLGHLDLIPFTGKFSLFGKLFMNYDVYLLAGAGGVNLVKKGTVNNSDCANGVCREDLAQPYTGMKLAWDAGVGMHAFANNYFAINLELHDLIFKNNAAGRNVTGSEQVNDADLLWTNNWMVGLNFMFFLPANVRVSH
jgi:outer membrane beta-barrel protein